MNVCMQTRQAQKMLFQLGDESLVLPRALAFGQICPNLSALSGKGRFSQEKQLLTGHVCVYFMQWSTCDCAYIMFMSCQ